MKLNKLTPQEEAVILKKGTEQPFTGTYLNNKETGVYICKQCETPLYRSSDKFDAHCGWPSFDDEIQHAVLRIADADGKRTEIVCAKCGAHLGHVFKGEQLTPKDTRHCVNSISLLFVPTPKTAIAYFASGCFWGTEYYFMRAKGVVATTVGYMGGDKKNPTYKEVCTGTTGHVETTQVEYNPSETSYDELVKLFFETHNFEQTDGQGPDKGSQYLSIIFYTDAQQQVIDEKRKDELTQMGFRPATKILPAVEFFPAEAYHQEYYDNKGGSPYCHIYKKIFK